MFWFRSEIDNNDVINCVYFTFEFDECVLRWLMAKDGVYSSNKMIIFDMLHIITPSLYEYQFVIYNILMLIFFIYYLLFLLFSKRRINSSIDQDQFITITLIAIHHCEFHILLNVIDRNVINDPKLGLLSISKPVIATGTIGLWIVVWTFLLCWCVCCMFYCCDWFIVFICMKLVHVDFVKLTQ